MPPVSPSAEFDQKGYVLIPELVPEAAREAAVKNLDALSERQRGMYGWTIPDGLTQTECFWPLIFNERLLAVVRALIGDDIRFLQHNDLHVNFSSYNWHRDSVCRTLSEGPDWDETEPYRIVRVGLYLQPRNAAAFQLGLLPGTHRLPSRPHGQSRQRLENMTRTMNFLRRMVSGSNPSPGEAEWLGPANGDAVIFDPRVIHTGSRAAGCKYSVFLAYGIPNTHYFNHAIYYRFLRPELGYQAVPVPLVAQLKEAGLYEEVAHTCRNISGATIPGFIQSFVARRVRHRL